MSAISFTSVISLCYLLSWYQIKTLIIDLHNSFICQWDRLCQYISGVTMKNNFVGTTYSTDVYSHYSDVISSTMASQITNVKMVCSTVSSGADQRKYQRSALLAFVRGVHQWPGNSPHKGPVTRKMFPFDDVMMMVNGTPKIYSCEYSADMVLSFFCSFFILNSIFISYFQLTDELSFVFYCTFQFQNQLNPSTCI